MAVAPKCRTCLLDEHNYHFGMRFKKITVILVVATLVVVTGLLLFTQTALFRKWLRNTITSQVNKQLGAELTIAELDGNLFGSIFLKDILLTNAPDTLITISEVSISWSFLELLNKTIRVNSLEVNGLFAHLVQTSDSTWNLMDIMPGADESQQSDSEPLSWIIKNDSILINVAALKIKTIARESSVPQRIDSIQISSSLRYSEDIFSLDLWHASMTIPEIPFVLNELAFGFQSGPEEVLIENFVLRTQQSEMWAEEDLFRQNENESFARFVVKPDLAEISLFFPELRIKGRPDIATELHLKDELLNFGMQVSALPGQQLDLSGNILWTDVPAFDINAAFRNLDIATWMDSISTSDITGELSIKGSGSSLDDLDVDLTTILLYL